MPSSTKDWSLICHRTSSWQEELDKDRIWPRWSRKMLTWNWLARNCVPQYFYPSNLSRESGPEDVLPCWYHLWSSSTETETWNQLRLMLSLQNYTSRYFINSYKVNLIRPNGFTRDHYLNHDRKSVTLILQRTRDHWVVQWALTTTVMRDWPSGTPSNEMNDSNPAILAKCVLWHYGR